jgi:hypothetical protein
MILPVFSSRLAFIKEFAEVEILLPSSPQATKMSLLALLKMNLVLLEKVRA